MIAHLTHLLVAALLHIVGPTVEEANAAAAAELDAHDGCDAPLLEQPLDCPERVRWALVAISDRESPGNYGGDFRWVGRHRGDSVHEGHLWRRGMRRGELGRRSGALHWWCPSHLDPEGMSTVGPHGLIYVFNVHWLGVWGNCVPWWAFASPAVSATVARERYLHACVAGESRWCPSPTAVALARARRCSRGVIDRAVCREERV